MISAMQPATRTNLTDSAAASLRAEIVSGRWAVGERIPTGDGFSPSARIAHCWKGKYGLSEGDTARAPN